MSTKRILSVTSTKKRNTMLTYANTSVTNGVSVTIGPGPLLVNGANASLSLFCPTAMDLYRGDGVTPGAPAFSAVRTSTTCYMRGFREHIRIQTSSGIPWFWRRICFTNKSPLWIDFANADTPTQTNGPTGTGGPISIDTSNGQQRIYFNQFVNNANNTVVNWYDTIFKGRQAVDWNDPMTASIDTARVDLKSDVTTTIKSGNQAGTVRDFKLWYPMNKNLVYAEDEVGDAEEITRFSVRDKQGMGDYYILDIFIPGTGASASDLLQLNGTSTMYWHEK